MKRIGWVGFVNDKPDFEKTTDDYLPLGEEGVPAMTVYKRKKDAQKRYEDVREVFVK
jgi:hypothetical protein